MIYALLSPGPFIAILNSAMHYLKILVCIIGFTELFSDIKIVSWHFKELSVD